MPPEAAPTGRDRRAPLYRLTAGLILAAALAALLPFPEHRPAPAEEPPAGAVYRPDGGQELSAHGPLAPNALTALNLGRRIDVTNAPARLLAALPSLGEKSAVKAASGQLTARQRVALRDFIRNINAPQQIDEKK
ncbi:MAG: hypothetical protein LBV79_07925 [Candidatus Adiutrix sp.]|nr:hypothetical protein [Candidatus Adiutrix sp.]